MYANQQTAACGASLQSGYAEPKAQKEITGQMERIYKEAEALNENATMLADRLTPLMHPTPPEPVSEKVGSGMSTGFGSELHGIACKLASVNQLLRQTMGRLEF